MYISDKRTFAAAAHTDQLCLCDIVQMLVQSFYVQHTLVIHVPPTHSYRNNF